MPMMNLVILYVKDVAKSGVFYRDLLGHAPEMDMPTYIGFKQPDGQRLSLLDETSPGAQNLGTGNRMELAFVVDDAAAVDATFEDWSAKGVEITQPPFDAPFGRTFLAKDPDGHWLRVCLP